MNILVIGSGGREHVLGWKLKKSKKCGKVYFAPGNAGTSEVGQNVPDLDVSGGSQKSFDAVSYFCRTNKIELVVIGPEAPLAVGMTDQLEAAGLKVFGPSHAGAQLEADKAYAKALMRAANVPTAESKTFKDAEPAIEYVNAHESPVVVKASGLAAGKGVIVCDNSEQAVAAINQMMVDKAFGPAADTIIVEERLTGQEVSILALVDGRNIFVLDTSQDHKQVGEGDVGPNTGGMGAYTPTPLVDDELMDLIQRDILVPTVDALRRDDIDFKGVLYAGLMLTKGGPKVLEYNVRFGDPECQPLMVRMKGDLLQTMLHIIDGRADKIDISWDQRVACCVVMCSEGYPGSYPKGVEITGIEDANAMDDIVVFHAGTTKDKDDKVVTNGGRVLNVVALGKDLAEARDKANAACEKINFAGGFYRKDIGDRVLKLKKANS